MQRPPTSKKSHPRQSHCLLFNATFDPVEEKWKALQNYEILKAQKFIDNVYQHILTRELVNYTSKCNTIMFFLLDGNFC